MRSVGAVCWQTYTSYTSSGAGLTELGAVSWETYRRSSLGLYVDNLQIFWGLLDPAWRILGTVCWQPTGLMVAAMVHRGPALVLGYRARSNRQGFSPHGEVKMI